MRFLRRGKVKEVYEVGAGQFVFRFTDSISVFDKVIPTDIPFKGESLCRSAAHWFERCGRLGVRTHFLGLDGGNEMRVRGVDILPYEKIGQTSKGYLVPLEFICRHYVAGSLWDRIRAGEVTNDDLGLPASVGVKYGDALPGPFIEVTTKLERVDRKLKRDEALALSGLDEERMLEIEETILRIDEMIRREVEPRGLIHADGKKEFAVDEEGGIMLVDTLGTADEDRWWMKRDYEEEGRCIEFSKEFVRQYYREIGYHARLETARAGGGLEPDIPPLPAEMVERVSRLYVESFEMITGERFRGTAPESGADV